MEDQSTSEANRQVKKIQESLIEGQAEIAKLIGPHIYKLLFEQIETGRSLAIVAGSLATVSIFVSEKLSNAAGFPFYICAIIGFLLTAALAMINVHFSVHNALMAHNKKWDEAMGPLDARLQITNALLEGTITPDQADIEDAKIRAQMKEIMNRKTEDKPKEPFFSHIIIGIFVVSITLMMLSFVSTLFFKNDRPQIQNSPDNSRMLPIPHIISTNPHNKQRFENAHFPLERTRGSYYGKRVHSHRGLSQQKISFSEVFYNLALGIGALIGTSAGIKYFYELIQERRKTNHLQRLRKQYSRDGLDTLFKLANTEQDRKKIYILDTRTMTRHWIESWATYLDLYFSPNDFKTVELEEFNQFKDAPSITSNKRK